MSYILEALKKAQAERQLGAAPTLHAVPVGAAPAAAVRKRRLPWLVIGGVALALAGAIAVWRMQTRAPKPAAVVVVATPPAPVVAAPPPMVVVPPSAPKPPPVVKAAEPAAPKPAPVAKTAAPVEEKLPSLRELPEAIRGSIPQVAFGGYMYSANPSDRLLLVDKALRHEGEEVAPGLVLEKLQPKAAVMNYKGYRYLVPY